MFLKTKKNAKKIKLNREEYAYCSGRCRALENNILSSGAISRIFEATDISEISRVLSDNDITISGDIVSSLKKDLQESFSLARDLIPDKEFIDALMLANDYHNLKVILKSFVPGNKSIRESGTNDPQEIFDIHSAVSEFVSSSSGEISDEEIALNFAVPSKYDPFDLLEIVRNDPSKFPDPDFEKIIKDAFRAFLRYSDPGDIDAQVDKYYFNKLAEYDELLDNEFFSKYRSFKADSANLLILLRLRAMRADPSRISSLVVEGGEVTKETVIELFTKSNDEIRAEYFMTSCEELAGFADSYGKEDSAMEFGKIVDNKLISMLYKTRFILFGPEIMLAYLIAKEMQFKNINIALTCLRNKVPLETALKMMRNTTD